MSGFSFLIFYIPQSSAAVTKEAGSEASSFPQITEFTLSSNEADVSNGEVTLTATATADETVET